MLTAFKDFGIAFPKPLPAVALDSCFQLTLRGAHRLEILLSFIGCRSFEASELLHIQRFHRAVLCWESDFESEESGQQSTIIPPKEWTQSSNGACYLIFPICEEDSLTVSSQQDPDNQYVPSRNWNIFLETCANEAQNLIRKTHTTALHLVAQMVS